MWTGSLLVERQGMPRWINYQDADDAYLEIGRPIIVPGAKRHRARAAAADGMTRAAPPTVAFLVLRRRDGHVAKRCCTHDEALAEHERLNATGTPHVIRKL
jgi:hypothetical protein